MHRHECRQAVRQKDFLSNVLSTINCIPNEDSKHNSACMFSSSSQNQCIQMYSTIRIEFRCISPSAARTRMIDTWLTEKKSSCSTFPSINSIHLGDKVHVSRNKNTDLDPGTDKKRLPVATVDGGTIPEQEKTDRRPEACSCHESYIDLRMRWQRTTLRRLQIADYHFLRASSILPVSNIFSWRITYLAAYERENYACRRILDIAVVAEREEEIDSRGKQPCRILFFDSLMRVSSLFSPSKNCSSNHRARKSLACFDVLSQSLSSLGVEQRVSGYTNRDNQRNVDTVIVPIED